MKNKFSRWLFVFMGVGLFAVLAFGQAFYHYSCAAQTCSSTAWWMGGLAGAVLLLVSLAVIWVVRAKRRQ